MGEKLKILTDEKGFFKNYMSNSKYEFINFDTRDNNEKNKSINRVNLEEKLSYYEEQGKYKEAIKIYKELISKKKSDYKLYFQLSELQEKGFANF